jgi:FkbM family methyltransferase
MLPGWTVRCHPAVEQFAYQPQLLDPEQAAELVDFVASCRPGMRLLDVGAHFGVFCLAALHHGGATARALAIKPSAAAAALLHTQAALNGVSERLTVIRAAAGARHGRIGMVDAGVLAAGYFVRDTEGRPAHDLTMVRMRTLDEVCAAHDFSPTHVKIDVEGAEADVLAGAGDLLSSPQPPVVFIELHNDMVRREGRRPQDTLERLRAHGYAVSTSRGASLDEDDMVRWPVVRCVARKRTGCEPGGGSAT